MKHIQNVLSVIAIALIPHISITQASPGLNVTSGPGKGHLLVVGGNAKSHAIYEKFIELAGGTEAAIVCVPRAGGQEFYDDNAGSAGTLRRR